MPELSIRKIIEKTLSGEIRIPSFQRGFVWEPEKVAFFIDSLYKGYPIGSLKSLSSIERLLPKKYKSRDFPHGANIQL